MKRRHVLDLLSAASCARSLVQFVTPRGQVETSFAGLWALSSRAASALLRSAPPGRVGGLLTPSADVVACLVATLRAGRDFVSLPLPGRGQDGIAYLQQLRTITDLAEIGAIVVEAAYSHLFGSTGHLKCPILVAERISEGATAPLTADPEPGQLIQFSSGTTGVPKGVRLSGEAIAASAEAILAALRIGGAPETFCGWVPLSHDMGLIGGLLATWVGSGRAPYTYICISPELFLARPMLWLETCSARGATITAAPTFAYQIMARHLPRSTALDLSNVRAAIVGAEPIGVRTLQAFASAAARHGFAEKALCPAYGLAEATVAVSMVPPEDPWKARSVSVDGRSDDYVSCGPALDCVVLAAPAIGAGAGPIRIRGPAVCSGYLPVRDAPADDWLDTGDLGVIEDGELFVTGRSDDLLCIAGRNIFAWELERVASTVSHIRPGDCAVVLDGDGRYAVLFESRNDGEVDFDETLVELRRRLAAAAGIGPSAVGCLPRGTLGKTASGKIQRNLIAANLGRMLDSCIARKKF
jgi:acyl-CoA synthetase (AMP-forming)/AMP-acid ligase II